MSDTTYTVRTAVWSATLFDPGKVWHNSDAPLLPPEIYSEEGHDGDRVVVRHVLTGNLWSLPIADWEKFRTERAS